jgi:acyl carrier protein
MPDSDLERELMAALQEWAPSLAGRLQAETPLFQSGQLDSLALFNLVVWIEDRTGSTVDVGSIDPVLEWSTVAHVLRYIDKHKSQR